MAQPADAPAGPAPLVTILADDLIWSTRLRDAVRAAGGNPRAARRAEDAVPGGPEGSERVIVDLTARAYDGVEAIRAVVAAGQRVIAVGQHDDAELRKRALAAGAERVFPYRLLFEDGPRILRRWLES